MHSLMAIMGTLAFGHSLFLAVFFFRRKNGLRLANRFLGFLLLALAIRITKSVLVVMFPATGVLAPALGLVGMAAIGPLLLLYFFSVLDFDFCWSKKQWWHFVFPVLLVLLLPFLNDDTMYLAYQVSVAQMLGYLLFSIYFLRKKLPGSGLIRELAKWLWLLVTAVSAIWTTFLFQLYTETETTYVLVTTCATAVLYGLSFWGMGRMGIFSKNKKSKNGKNTSVASEELGNQIKHLFEKENIYTDANLTVVRLAEQLHVPPYLVSRTVNEVFGKTFPELLNEHRIADSAKRLLQPDYDHLSIEGIASESGFNSLSAFYTAFKKINGMTPAEWRKQNTFS